MGTVHYHNYRRISGVEVVAIVGITDQSKECSLAWNVPLFVSITDLLANIQVDIIDICAPTFLHKELTLVALDRGCHVICEKPIALTAKDAREMYAKADTVGKQLYIAQVLEFSAETTTLRGLVETKKYGKVIDARFERVTAKPTWIQNGWLFDKAKSGLLPFDLHIHDLFTIVCLFGTPEKFSYTSTTRSGAEFPEHYRVCYEYPNLSVSAEAAWFNACYPFTAQWRVVFERAVAEYTEGELWVYPVSEEAYHVELLDEPKIETGINLPPTGMFFHELGHFVDMARLNQPSGRVKRDDILVTISTLERFN